MSRFSTVEVFRRTPVKGVLTISALSFLLAGCSASNEVPIPTVTETVTLPAVTVTATPPATDKRDLPLALGKTATTATGGTVTVYAHKKNVEPQDPNQEAIDVKVCVGPKAENAEEDLTPVIGTSPWAIFDAEDRRYESANTMWSHEGAQPGYPVEQRVDWNDCVRGWVIIQGQSQTKMVRVRYTISDTLLEWKLP